MIVKFTQIKFSWEVHQIPFDFMSGQLILETEQENINEATNSLPM